MNNIKIVKALEALLIGYQCRESCPDPTCGVCKHNQATENKGKEAIKDIKIIFNL